VYHNIQAMLESQRFLQPGTSTDAALQCFDDLVRGRLPQSVESSNVHWQHCFAVSASFFGRALDSLASDISGGASWRIT